MGSTRLTQSAREVGRVPHGRTARETWVLLRALRCAWGMGQRLSMATRHEITRKYAKEYERASKKDRGRMLDELVAVPGKPRARTYGYDTLKVLIEVWTLIGEPCGKYLAPIMAATLAQLEAFGELGKVAERLNAQVREQLVTMSPATIDRMLKPTKDARYPAAKSATRPGATLRSSIVVR